MKTSNEVAGKMPLISINKYDIGFEVVTATTQHKKRCLLNILLKEIIFDGQHGAIIRKTTTKHVQCFFLDSMQ
jgi:hypothetical protein